MKRLGVLGSVVILLVAAGIVGLTRLRAGSDDRPTDLGTTQPLLIGTAVSIAPRLDVPAYSYQVAPETSYEGRVTISSRPRPAKDQPAARGRALVRVSVILDLRTLLPIGEADFQEVAFPARQGTTRTFPMILPPLEPGHHCVMVTVLEDPAATIGRPAVDHASVAVIDVSTTPAFNEEHCVAQQEVQNAEVRDDLPLSCATPVIGPDPDRARLRSRMSAGDEVWALVPSCPDTHHITTMFVYNGRPVLERGPFAPFFTPSDGRSRVVKLPSLPKGSIRMITVVSKESGTYSEAFGARPIVVR
jgi:hypothetical protein